MTSNRRVFRWGLLLGASSLLGGEHRFLTFDCFPEMFGGTTPAGDRAFIVRAHPDDLRDQRRNTNLRMEMLERAIDGTRTGQWAVFAVMVFAILSGTALFLTGHTILGAVIVLAPTAALGVCAVLESRARDIIRIEVWNAHRHAR